MSTVQLNHAFTWDESEWERLWFWENVPEYIKKQNTQTTHINKNTFWTLGLAFITFRRIYDQMRALLNVGEM